LKLSMETMKNKLRKNQYKRKRNLTLEKSFLKKLATSFMQFS